MKFKFKNLSGLYSDMKRNKKSLEEFTITYNNVEFDCILDVDSIPFELMIGAINHNFACILYIEIGFITEMSDKDYFALCDILNLNYNKHHFSSFAFLKFIDERSPHKCNNKIVPVRKLVPFRENKISKKDKAEGFIFCGWLTHKGNNNGHVKNIDKTEKFFGKQVAAYCKKNDISSKWTTDPSKQVRESYPWENS